MTSSPKMAAGLDDVIISLSYPIHAPSPFVTVEAFEVMYCPNTHDFSRAFVGTVLVLLFVVAYFFVAQER